MRGLCERSFEFCGRQMPEGEGGCHQFHRGPGHHDHHGPRHGPCFPHMGPFSFPHMGPLSFHQHRGPHRGPHGHHGHHGIHKHHGPRGGHGRHGHGPHGHGPHGHGPHGYGPHGHGPHRGSHGHCHWARPGPYDFRPFGCGGRRRWGSAEPRNRPCCPRDNRQNKETNTAPITEPRCRSV